MIRKINEEQGKLAKTNIQIAGDVTKYPDFLDNSKITDSSQNQTSTQGKRTARGGGQLPFKRETTDTDKKGEEKEVKESKDLKDIRKRNKTANLSRRKLEDYSSS